MNIGMSYSRRSLELLDLIGAVRICTTGGDLHRLDLPDMNPTGGMPGKKPNFSR